MLLEARNVVQTFGELRAVDDASLTVDEGEIVGLIGPNGAGKSTFFNCAGRRAVFLPPGRSGSTEATSPEQRRRLMRAWASRAPFRCRRHSRA